MFFLPDGALLRSSIRMVLGDANAFRNWPASVKCCINIFLRARILNVSSCCCSAVLIMRFDVLVNDACGVFAVALPQCASASVRMLMLMCASCLLNWNV